MILKYEFIRKSIDFAHWAKGLPVPYSLKKCEEADKRYESLKIKNGL